MSSRTRKILLFLTLAAVVALAVFAPPLDQPAAPARTAEGARSAQTAEGSAKSQIPEKSARASELSREFPQRNVLGKARENPFDVQSWQPPPPKVVIAPPVPPPPPPPPEMSYRFAGRLMQDGKVQIFVSKGDVPVVAKVGDLLDGYLIEAIAANSINLVHPPTGHRQSIFIPPVGSIDAGFPGSNAAAVTRSVPVPAPQRPMIPGLQSSVPPMSPGER